MAHHSPLKQPMQPYNSNISNHDQFSSNAAQRTAKQQNLIIHMSLKPLSQPSKEHAKENQNPPVRVRRQSHSYRLYNRAYHHEPYPTSPAQSSQNLPLSPYSPPSLPPIVLLQSQLFWLILYFLFNLSLTLYNKLVLVRFPFPYSLTALHTLLGAIGGHILVQSGFFKPVGLNLRETAVLFAFSILYTVNIVVSNVSLQLVTVAFHQVVRAATPIFTIVLLKLLLGISSSRAKIISLTPVVAGVGLATYGDYYFTIWGFLLTLLGTILASFKTILTNLLQTSPSSSSTHPPLSFIRSMRLPRLHPLALLYLLSPLAFVECVLLAYYSGELGQVRHYVLHEMTPAKAIALALNGCLAFGLNVVSFSANKKVGALSMTVATNVKQVLTMLCGVLVFDLTITTTNALGILLTILGGVTYGYVDFSETNQLGNSKGIDFRS